MQLDTLKDSEFSFRLKSTNPNKPTVTVDCQAASQRDYDEWMGTLNQIQDQQTVFLNKLVNPLHN